MSCPRDLLHLQAFMCQSHVQVSMACDLVGRLRWCQPDAVSSDLLARGVALKTVRGVRAWPSLV
eukprot:CAMPEP_0203864666 /NCGR_PEP_ID=MMETSP0359-20131031/14901_1 /ASSEMBLY_ACC=CAM_ASM_000338 /TAXON_ID=268821 /ORGANISM="Scrippsiella Hangoei, Strain SHTV-5" /LENGTH=63 /DNA_ID=CAMNT_0050782445 /DNA_START=26 /DNA_END=214 /DNA_ORIENTATION=+